MKFYKLIKGEGYSDRFQTGDIYKSNDNNWSLFNNTIQDLVDLYPQDWKEVSELEYLEQETDNTMTKEERIKRLEKELDSQFKLLNELKKEIEQPEFEVGDWVWCEGKCTYLIRITKFDNINVHGYGFDDYKGHWQWFDEQSVIGKDGIIRKATEDDIKEALDKERKRRGIQEDSLGSNTIRCFYNPSKMRDLSMKSKDGIAYDMENDAFWVNCNVVYYQGTWAEPHKNKIRDYVVEEKSGSGESWYKVGCEQLPNNFMTRLQNLTKKHDIKIELEGTDVTDDIINLNL